MTDQDKKILHLKFAARAVSENANIVYYTDNHFHRECLADSVEQLKDAIAEYEESE